MRSAAYSGRAAQGCVNNFRMAMTARIALLRAVNVGGTNKIAMAELRTFAVALGLADARTLLHSGNLVFTHAAAPKDLETLLEREAAMRLGLITDFFVRTAKEWDAVIAGNPFPEVALHDPARLMVMPLKKAPAAAAVKALEAAIRGPERICAIGDSLYASYPEGTGNSKLTIRLIESKLDTRGTARNWNTTLKLAALAGGKNRQ
jgi:uncharacterized protein (DUF1697 family)